MARTARGPDAAQQPSSSCGARPSAITILLAAGIPIRRFTRPFFPGLYPELPVEVDLPAC